MLIQRAVGLKKRIFLDSFKPTSFYFNLEEQREHTEGSTAPTADFTRKKLTYHKDPVVESRKVPHHISAPHLPPVSLVVSPSRCCNITASRKPPHFSKVLLLSLKTRQGRTGFTSLYMI